EEMPVIRTRLVIPYGLTTLLEGVSRAAVVNHPEDLAEFFSLYFQGLAAFHREHPSLELAELVEQFEPKFLTAEEAAEEPAGPAHTAAPRDCRQRESCSDTQQNQLPEGPDARCSSKLTQRPSSTSSFAGSTSPPAPEGAATPEPAALVYVPAEPAALAAHLLGNSSSSCSLGPAATSLQPLPAACLPSQHQLTPEGASERASAVSHPSLRDVATSL
ncbi:CABYR protein, partial [Tricholaema leucomelas]|nr:CABYR protein [Tricholaema leucomelas]